MTPAALNNTPNMVTLTDDNFIAINGEKFFPHGFYIKETRDNDVIKNHVKTLGEAGFNTVYIEPVDNDRIESVFDEAEAQNVKIIYGPVKAFGPNSTNLAETIADISQETSLLAYSIGDDVHDGKMYGRPGNVGEVKEFHDSIKEMDPNHLTFVAMGGGSTDTVYDDRNWDLGGRQIYPVNGGTFISATFDYIRRTVVESEKNDQAAIAVLQAFDYDILQNPNQPQVDEKRLPTPDEFENMLYQSLVAGAQGVIYYAYDYYDTGIIDDPALFARATETASQVETLTPFLVSGTHELITLGHQLHLATWEVGNEFVAAIVYSGDYQTFADPGKNDPYTKEVTFELPEGYENSDVENLFNDETFAQINDDGTVTVIIDRLDVQVARFTKEQDLENLETEYNSTIFVDVLAKASGTDLQLVNVVYTGYTAAVSIENDKITFNPLAASTEGRVEIVTYIMRDVDGKEISGSFEVTVDALEITNTHLDVSFGTTNDDLLIAKDDGLDRLMAGAGEDVFVFNKGTGLDIVYDYNDGIDHIGLNGISFEELLISEYRDGDTLLQVGNDRMILRDVDYLDLSASDFVDTPLI